MDYYKLIIQELDAGAFEVTAWEAAFLETHLERIAAGGKFWLSPKQQAIVDRMERQYLKKMDAKK